MNRRVVTGHGPDGAATILSDGPAPRSLAHTAPRGMVNTILWHTGPDSIPGRDVTPTLDTVVPGTGETVVFLLTFPPESVFAEPGFDPQTAATEQVQITPGLAELFEQDTSGMHTTPTIDYAVVIDGELVLDLGEERTTLQRGDVVVQGGIRHAWRNQTDQPATIFVVLVGA